jgi:hypothetical protein
MKKEKRKKKKKKMQKNKEKKTTSQEMKPQKKFLSSCPFFFWAFRRFARCHQPLFKVVPQEVSMNLTIQQRYKRIVDGKGRRVGVESRRVGE